MAALPYPFNPARFVAAGNGTITDAREEFFEKAVQTIHETVASLFEDARRPRPSLQFGPARLDFSGNDPRATISYKTIFLPTVTEEESDELAQEIYERLLVNQCREKTLRALMRGGV